MAVILALSGSRAPSQDVPPVPGTFVNVGGHRLHFLCAGSGSPTVVVEGGLGDFSTDWSLVQQRARQFTRICAYDRAGYAWSELGPMPRTYDQLTWNCTRVCNRSVSVAHSCWSAIRLAAQ